MLVTGASVNSSVALEEVPEDEKPPKASANVEGAETAPPIKLLPVAKVEVVDQLVPLYCSVKVTYPEPPKPMAAV